LNIIDITGTIHDGMWTYGDPYPEVVVEEIAVPEWVSYPTYSWRFALGGQTGTYLETALHVRRDAPPVIDLPLESLINRDAVILRIEGKDTKDDCITREELEACCAEIREGDCILLSVGRDAKWRDSDYVTESPYLLKEAMDWLLDHNPFLIGADWPRMDSWENPQKFFHRFFDEGVLLLAPVVNLGKVVHPRPKLTIMPMKVEQTAAVPARAILIEE
jgi:kynurenine formamidase